MPYDSLRLIILKSYYIPFNRHKTLLFQIHNKFALISKTEGG